MVLAMTHEEVVADLVRREIHSYRQLPRLIYHIQTKWRDDPRPRAGLIRVREFTMKDSYSLDADWEGLDRQYRAHYQAYFNIFHRCGLPVIAVGSDVGMMGGSMAHEYMYLTPIGEDTLLLCDECGYAANRQIAPFRKPPPRPKRRCRWRRWPRPAPRPSPTWPSSWACPERDGQGGLHGRHCARRQRGGGRREVCLRRRARRHGAERDEAGQCCSRPKSCVRRTRRKSAPSAPCRATARRSG